MASRHYKYNGLKILRKTTFDGLEYKNPLALYGILDDDVFLKNPESNRTLNYILSLDNSLNPQWTERDQYAIIENSSSSDDSIKSFSLTKNGEKIGVDIDLPKSILIVSATIETATKDGEPYPEAKAKDKYIDFVLNNETSSHLYIPLVDLVKEYSGSDSIDVSENNILSLKIDENYSNGLSISENGLKLDLATEESNGAMSKSDKELINAIPSTYLTKALANESFVKAKQPEENYNKILKIDSEGNLIFEDEKEQGILFENIPNSLSRIFINLNKISDGNLTIKLPIKSSYGFYVLWGDRTKEYFETPVAQLTHSYKENPDSNGFYISLYGDFRGLDFSEDTTENKLSIISIDYDKSVKIIPKNAFNGCVNLIEFSSNNAKFEQNTFNGCSSLKEIEIGSSFSSELDKLHYIGDSLNNDPIDTVGLFVGCSNLKKVKIKEGIDYLEKFSLSNSQFNEIDLPYSLTDIYDYSFYGCQNIKEIHFKKGLESLDGINIFNNSSIKTLYFESETPPVIDYGVFASIETIFVPSDYLSEYKNATNWTTYANKIYPLEKVYYEEITIPVDSWNTTDNTAKVTAIGSTNEPRNIINMVYSGDDGIEISEARGGQFVLTCGQIPTEASKISVFYQLSKF